MKLNLKRITALAGAILLVGLFLTAIILAVTGAPKEQLMAVFFTIIFISMIFYAMGLMTRILKGSENTPGENPSEETDRASQDPRT